MPVSGFDYFAENRAGNLNEMNPNEKANNIQF